MKFTCSRQDLLDAATNVQRAVSTKSNIPALEGILIKAQGETLSLSGYDPVSYTHLDVYKRQVLPQHQAVFRPGGHHPVGVGAALGDQVVNEGADIGGGPIQQKRRFSLHPPGGVDTGDQTLGRCFLIAGGAIELPGPKEARPFLAFQCGVQLLGIDRKSTRLNSSHEFVSRMPSSA